MSEILLSFTSPIPIKVAVSTMFFVKPPKSKAATPASGHQNSATLPPPKSQPFTDNIRDKITSRLQLPSRPRRPSSLISRSPLGPSPLASPRFSSPVTSPSPFLSDKPNLTRPTSFTDFDMVFFNEDVERTPTSGHSTPLSSCEH